MTDTELEYYIVEAVDEKYEHKPDTANEHRISLPIVYGPYEDGDAAHRSAQNNGYYAEGLMVVSIQKGEVPEDWRE